MNGRLQTQLKVTPRPAFTVVRTALLQRKCACGQHTIAGGECAECRKKQLSLQRRAMNNTEAYEVPPIVHEVLRSPSQPLDPATRAFMEPRFGHDFGQVRVHTDAKAAESARAVDALAYTVGRDIVFGAGQYVPGENQHKSTLAHEMAHTIQQGTGMKRVPDKLNVTNPADASEREAEATAQAIMQGRPVDLNSPAATQIARQAPSPIPVPTPTPSPTSTPTPTPAGGSLAFLDLQIDCVTKAGGCSTPSSIPTFDARCRTNTGYNGPTLVEADLVCATAGLGIARSLERAYPGWRTVLPSCPCTLSAALNSGDLSIDNRFIRKYHKGAENCVRSDSGFSSVPGTSHGQQCCYDARDRLITEGQGAGTPDVWRAALGSYRRHWAIDSDPWEPLGWETYNQFWIPDNGNNCPSIPAPSPIPVPTPPTPTPTPTGDPLQRAGIGEFLVAQARLEE